MAQTKSNANEKFSYAEINKVLIAVNTGKKEDRVPKALYEQYTGGKDPIVVLGKNNEPPRVRKDIYQAAVKAVSEDTRGAATAKEMLKNVNSLNKGQSEKSPEVERTNVLAILQAEGKAKPVAREVFNEVRNLLDREKGGLSKEGFAKYKGDAEVVAAATKQRDGWEQNPKEAAKDKEADARSTETLVSKSADILKLLKAGPGEKPISDPKVYRQLTAIVDTKEKGGLKTDAYNAFKAAADKGDDTAKEVVAAAEAHRKAFVKPAEKTGVTKENAALVVAVLNRRQKDEQPIAKEDFAKVNHLINRYTGTLTQKAETQVKESKDFPEVAKANTERKSYNQEQQELKAASKAPAAQAQTQ